VLYFQKMQLRLYRIMAHCGYHEHVVEDVYHTAAAPASLDFGVGLSSAAGMSSGAGHEEVPELRLDTTADVLLQLIDGPDETQPL
jgi:hypothetical protein